MPSYHDLHVTAEDIPRTSIFNLPYGLQVVCNRVGGWSLIYGVNLLAGEYEGPDKWLILDVNGIEIVNSRDNREEQE